MALQEKYIVLEGVIKDFFSLLKSSDLLKFRRTILIFFVTLRKRLTGEDSTFVSFFGKKGEKNMAMPGFELMISRSEADRANNYTIEA